MTEEMTTRKSFAGCKIIRELGRGGMGVVYLAIMPDGREVALKTVLGLEPAVAQRFRTEISILRGLSHPHVVDVIAHGTENEMPWYAMAFIDGEPFGQHLSRHKVARALGKDSDRMLVETLDFPDALGTCETAVHAAELPATTVDPPTAHEALLSTALGDPIATLPPSPAPPAEGAALKKIDIASERPIWIRLGHVAQALRYLHGQGIVHGDLKPGNVLVDTAGRAMLMDFGLSTRTDARITGETLDTAGIPAGTAAYMAPEQVQGNPVDARTDLYALGCMMYEAATGELPFVRDSALGLLRAHVFEKPQAVSTRVTGLGEALAHLIMRLLEKDPRQRPGYAQTVLYHLAEAGIETGPLTTDKPISGLYSPNLVGRKELVETVTANVRALRREGSAMMMLSGESGVGKSRIVAEAVREARRSGTLVLRGQGEVMQGRIGTARLGTPLGYFGPTFQRISDVCIKEGARSADRIVGPRGPILWPFVPGLAHLPGQADYLEVPELDAQAAKIRIFRALLDTVMAFANDRPLVWVLEDLQWADGLTMECLAYLVRNLGDRPVFLLASYRSDEETDEIRALAQMDTAEIRYVRRLGRDVVPQMIREMLASTEPDPKLEDYVCRHAEGNPFFVGECLRAAIADGFLSLTEEGRWFFDEDKSEALVEAPLPERLAASLSKRLGRLAGDELTLCRAAAALGRTVSRTLLHHVVGWEDQARFDQAVHNLRRKEIFDAFPEDDSTEFFVHDKLVETAYAGLSEGERRPLHGRAAAWLEQRSALDEPIELGRLAWHLEAGGRIDKARATYFEAFREAVGQYAHGEAEHLLEMGLRLSNHEDETTLSAKIEFVDGVLLKQGRGKEAEEILAEFLTGTWRTKAPTQYTTALRLKGRILQDKGEMDAALEIFWDARERCREFNPQENRQAAIVLVDIANTHAMMGRQHDALGCYADAIQIWRQLGESALEAVCLGNIGLIYKNLGEYERAEQLTLDALAMARQYGDLASESRHLSTISEFRVQQRLFDDAIDLNQSALKIAREIGNRITECIGLLNLGCAHLQKGTFRVAHDLFREARTISHEVSNRRVAAYSILFLARVHRMRGGLAEARCQQADALALLREIGIKDALGECLCEWGHLKLHDGELANDELDEARELGEELSVGPTSALAKAVARLERAVAAFERGETLYYGQCLEDYPENIQKELLGEARSDQ